MAIFFVQYEARPTLESEDFGEAGGAYVNCWVKSDSKKTAMRVAIENIRDNNWQILSIEKECREVTEDAYPEGNAGLEYHRQASVDGECYVYDQWPDEPQDEDAVH